MELQVPAKLLSRTMFVINLEEKGKQLNRPVQTVIVNCRQIDTQYRVLSHIGNSLLEITRLTRYHSLVGQLTEFSANL